MSNRKFKLDRYKNNPYCYYCKELMLLTNDKEIKGTPHPKMCTVEHLISRFHPERWVKRKSGEIRRVLACFECNNRRSNEEQAQKTKEEIRLRSEGFSLNPRGKPLIVKTCHTIEEVLDTLKNNGIVLTESENKCTTNS